MEIIDKELQFTASGFSGLAGEKDYCETAFTLMDKMWPVVRSEGLKHKGMNIWVFEAGEQVFAGVELENPNTDTALEQKVISLPKYAYYKHIGPYNLIKQAGDNMRNELHAQGIKTTFPYIEIYGHWTDDESKLETELIMALG